jgi:uncharacterized membrane protein YbhN (UPF0104 family)
VRAFLSPNGRKTLGRLITLLLVIATLSLVGRQLGQGWSAARDYPWQCRPGYLLLSLVLAQTGYMILARAWRSVLRAIAIRVSFTTSYWIIILSGLGRYLPGRVWQFGAAAYLAREVGLHAREIAASLVVYQLYLVPVGVVLTLAWGDLPAFMNTPWLRLCAWIGCLVAGAAAFWPHVLLHWIRPLANRLGMPPERWRMDWRRKLAVVVQCAVGWLFLAAAFGLLVISVTQLDLHNLPELARISLASYLAGYLSLVTPGGLGVREGVMALLLTPLAGAGPSAALALLARFWVTITEVLALVPAWYWYRKEVKKLASDSV